MHGCGVVDVRRAMCKREIRLNAPKIADTGVAGTVADEFSPPRADLWLVPKYFCLEISISARGCTYLVLIEARLTE